MSDEVTSAEFGLDSDMVRRALKNITSSTFDPKSDIDIDLFETTFNKLNEAVSKGFGETKIGGSNFDYVNSLRENIAEFSAFKTHKQQTELLKHITDEKGNVRSFTEFRKAVTPILQNYNVNWLQTEYSTTLLRAQTARVMRDAVENKDIFPCLEWMPSTSVNPRSKHRAYYGKVFKVGDPFLATNSPGSLYGCKCSLQSTTKKATNGTTKASVKPTLPKREPLSTAPVLWSIKVVPYNRPSLDSLKIASTFTLLRLSRNSFLGSSNN